jgi:hypothetical protein
VGCARLDMAGSRGTYLRVATDFHRNAVGLHLVWLSLRRTGRSLPILCRRSGRLPRLNRRTIYAGGRISENDGERILNVLNTALGTALVDPSVIDPGVFDLAAVGTADVGYNALQLAQDAGFSGEGLLFETADGFIGYTDANRRLENERARVIEAPFGVLSSDGISILQQLADITNAVTVTFDWRRRVRGGHGLYRTVWQV